MERENKCTACDFLVKQRYRLLKYSNRTETERENEGSSTCLLSTKSNTVTDSVRSKRRKKGYKEEISLVFCSFISEVLLVLRRHPVALKS